MSLTSRLAPFLLLAALAEGATPDRAAGFAADVRTLAADDMEGRGLGTAGLQKAAAYIETRLKQLGLAPAFGASFRQPFDVKTGVTRDVGNRLEGIADEDWTPLAASSSGDFAGELVFAGYGIEAPALGYQELAGLDLRGKSHETNLFVARWVE